MHCEHELPVANLMGPIRQNVIKYILKIRAQVVAHSVNSPNPKHTPSLDISVTFFLTRLRMSHQNGFNIPEHPDTKKKTQFQSA